MSKDWEMEKPAIAICDRLGPSAFPHEILKLEEATAALIVNIDGVDYVMTLQRAPKQRQLPN